MATRPLLIFVLIATLLLAACQAATPAPMPTSTAEPTATTPPPTATTPPPTATAEPTATPSPTSTPAPTVDPNIPLENAQLGDEWLRPKDGMVMVYVPAGTFMMGSTEQEIDNAFAMCVEIRIHCNRAHYEDEEYREVTLEGFWIDKYEVTNAQYQLCVDDGACEPSYFANGAPIDITGANQPVTGISWHDAVAYAEWVGAELPTEEQWEYAARGEERRIYPWGDTFDGTKLNCGIRSCPNDGYPYTAPVGSYPEGASWVGALDMAGNVWEWTSSPYDEFSVVLRGGLWNLDQESTRASNRAHHFLITRNYYAGVRLVRIPHFSSP